MKIAKTGNKWKGRRGQGKVGETIQGFKTVSTLPINLINWGTYLWEGRELGCDVMYYDISPTYNAIFADYETTW